MVDLAVAVSAVEQSLAAVPSVQWARLDGEVVRELNVRLLRAESRLAAIRLAAVRRLDELDLARAHGACSTAALLAQDHGGDRAGQERFVRVARTLTQVGAAETERLLAQAQLSVDQAGVIARSIAGLPSDADEADRRRAERVMLEAANRLKLPDLRRRGERLADTMRSKQDADAAFDATVGQRERTARDRATLRLWDDPDGSTTSGRFTIPRAEGDLLRAVLQGLAAPRRRHLKESSAGAAAGVGGIPILPEHRDGVAFTDLLSRLPTDALPQHGGAAATLAVLIDLDSLTGRVARAGSLAGSGTPISAGRARRQACTAGSIPMVLGGDSVPLDLGRRTRLFTTAQRLAMAVRDGGCTFPGCDKPPGWTEAHHITPWSRGGTTTVDDGALECPVHHHIVHDEGWQVRIRNGRVEHRKPGTDRWLVNDRYRPWTADRETHEDDADGVGSSPVNPPPAAGDLGGGQAISACRQRTGRRVVTIRLEPTAPPTDPPRTTGRRHPLRSVCRRDVVRRPSFPQENLIGAVGGRPRRRSRDPPDVTRSRRGRDV